MKKHQIHIHRREILADTLTSVGIYLSLRDKFPNAVMLESSDYHGVEHTYTYIGIQPIMGFKVQKGVFYADLKEESYQRDVNAENTVETVEEFLKSFEVVDDPKLSFAYKGLFGYMTYDSVQLFEDIQLRHDQNKIPTMMYHLYKHIIAINHINHKLNIITATIGDEEYNEDEISSLIQTIKKVKQPVYDFKRVGGKVSNFKDEEFVDIVKTGIDHCVSGDVFQVVLSRQFNQTYKGDDFQVYRALRAVSPSPYLFYFDMGSFRIFGSSPEAQLVIKDDKVSIYPIAGTFRRTGDDTKDAELAKKLTEDPKENAEHAMLVDLARNDLSRCGTDVQLEVYKEIQYFSHVIHLVSKITAKLSPEASRVRMIGDTFPAGTLSGAPKYRAMELIDELENTGRCFYGGAIGILDFNGNFNSAIVIRSFLSKDNTLTFQAGAGVVADSNPNSELQEVENKLRALNNAIILAEEI
ncbi:MAG TPA: anthranilate synthase component I family protein [Chitinophagales bacterium]|nr:anthranilate synthase component I family protein [Chitinophagales bacterium]